MSFSIDECNLLNKLFGIEFVLLRDVYYIQDPGIIHIEGFLPTPVESEDTVFRYMFPAVCHRAFIGIPAVRTYDHFRALILENYIDHLFYSFFNTDARLSHFIGNIMNGKKTFWIYLADPDILVVNQNQITVTDLQADFLTAVALESNIIDVNLFHAG